MQRVRVPHTRMLTCYPSMMSKTFIRGCARHGRTRAHTRSSSAQAACMTAAPLAVADGSSGERTGRMEALYEWLVLGAGQ